MKKERRYLIYWVGSNSYSGNTILTLSLDDITIDKLYSIIKGANPPAGQITIKFMIELK